MMVCSSLKMALNPTVVPSARISDNSPKDKWSTFKVRSKYYLPILQWLPLYNVHLLLGDLIAGITLSCLLIPQGLSYATALCKLEAVHGLYAIAFPAITYAVFGMSRYSPACKHLHQYQLTLAFIDKCQ